MPSLSSSTDVLPAMILQDSDSRASSERCHHVDLTSLPDPEEGADVHLDITSSDVCWEAYLRPNLTDEIRRSLVACGTPVDVVLRVVNSIQHYERLLRDVSEGILLLLTQIEANKQGEIEQEHLKNLLHAPRLSASPVTTLSNCEGKFSNLDKAPTKSCIQQVSASGDVKTDVSDVNERTINSDVASCTMAASEAGEVITPCDSQPHGNRRYPAVEPTSCNSELTKPRHPVPHNSIAIPSMTFDRTANVVPMRSRIPIYRPSKHVQRKKQGPKLFRAFCSGFSQSFFTCCGAADSTVYDAG